MTIAELKRRLAPGVEFTVEFIGVNRRYCRPGSELTRRRVETNKSQLVSRFLDGPRAGELIYLPWAGITAVEREGSVYLSGPDTGGEFLRIQI